MKKILIAAITGLAALSLSGCATIDVPDLSTDSDIVVDGDNLGSAKPAQMPPLPDSLAIRRGRLPVLTDRTPEGQQLDAIQTDRLHNDMAYQVNALISLWECVRTRLNENKASDECLKGN